MNYEKAYKDALERAKGAHNSAKSDKKNDVTDKITEYTIQLTETIFPELKESEEERIRKSLIDFLDDIWHLGKNANFDKYSKADCADWIAWLEKQGEQKPNFCHHEVDFSGCSEEYRKAYYDGWNNCNQQHAQLEAQQKPTWSEEDERMFTLCALSVKTRYNDGLLTCNEYEHVSLWLKSIKDRVHPQPKQEWSWSEDDEQMLQKALNTIRYTLSIPIDKEDDPCFAGSSTIAWLKSIKNRVKPQPKCVWSEEDKLKMDTLIHVINNQKGSAIFEGLLQEELVNWLKSLRGRMKG